ncbi:MAG: hypothetical protein ACOYNN_07825 [Terrimicrobiaceae bacterium]
MTSPQSLVPAVCPVKLVGFVQKVGEADTSVGTQRDQADLAGLSS